MDLKERRILVSLMCTLVIFGWYSLHVYRNYFAVNPELLNDFSFWGKAFLLLIPISVVAQIIIHIIFAIITKITTSEDLPSKTDEMDKLIELKTMRVAHWIFISGFVSAMSVLALGMQPYVFFLILTFSGFGASVISEILSIIYYRRGV